MLQAVEVVDIFQEHSTVIASFSVPDQMVTANVWPLPSEIPWHLVDLDKFTQQAAAVPFVTQAPNDWLHDFSVAFESSLQGCIREVPCGRLPSSCRGRGQRTHPETRSFPIIPLRPSRSGEDSLRHDFVCMEVKRWFKQLRRLQSLVHALAANKDTPAAHCYRIDLWRSILQAPGFAHGFSRWWATRQVQLQGAPEVLPVNIPSTPAARLIHEDFRANFRRLDPWHIRRRQEILKARFATSRAELLRSLKESSPPQVDTLQVHRTYTVLAVEPSTQQVQVEPAVDARSSSLWTLQDTRVVVSDIDCDGEVCTIVGPLQVEEGDELEQLQTLSSVSDVQSEFIDLWKRRWQRHAGLSPSDWQRVLDFSAAFLPSSSFTISDISVDQWRAAVRRFKPRAARGPDGFAKQDLAHMTDDQINNLLGFLHAIELGNASWPDSWLLGLVLSLDKQNGRTDAQAYRPIVLFSIIYRAWAGIRARQLLSFVASLQQHAAYGFLPGKEAMEYWTCLQADIELCVQSGTALFGLSTDLVKAFNGLPRIPLFGMASVMGVPDRLLIPWQRFLQQMERRFVVRQCVSAPIRSDVGFAEGCPLSPVAMAIMDTAWHVYLSVFEPRVVSHSFVDNLAATAFGIFELARGWTLTQSFCDMLGLELDKDKTYVWATTPQARKALRVLQLPIKLAARDLGGLMSYGPKVRIAELQERGEDVLHRLRSAATQSLKIHPAGSSSMLRLSLSGHLDADPGYYQARRTLLDFRRMCHKQPRLVDQWRMFQYQFDGHYHQGPFSKLVQTFSQLGWSLAQIPFFSDEEGLRHDLLGMPSNLLVKILDRSWLAYVAVCHRHRQTMRDMHGIEPSLAMLDHDKLSAIDQSRVGAIQSGQTQHLFTDGSCLFTETPDYALAAWAVIHANSNAVLVSEHLGGLLQTIPRAELTAILAAIQWTIKSKTTAVIWSDAQYVVEGVLALQAVKFLYVTCRRTWIHGFVKMDLRTLFFEVAELTLPQTKRHLTVEAAVEDPPAARGFFISGYLPFDRSAVWLILRWVPGRSAEPREHISIAKDRELKLLSTQQADVLAILQDPKLPLVKWLVGALVVLSAANILLVVLTGVLDSRAVEESTTDNKLVRAACLGLSYGIVADPGTLGHTPQYGI
ncbi:ML5 [Symbiodinium sp. KB8]|nr:ML5 [Symbiodinium sp. KB8]